MRVCYYQCVIKNNMVIKKVNEDLDRERKRCNFNVEELTNYLDDGVQETNRRRAVENKVLSIEGIRDTSLEEYLSHKEKYENAIRKAVLLYKVLKEMEDSKQTLMEKYRRFHFRNQIESACFKENSPFGVHIAMFIPSLITQADDEQQKIWLTKADKMKILGTYAQTELGHGTFIGGIETSATYDPQTEEFVLHSPTLSSVKWWPGNLGHTVNHCIVMAQLYIKGKNYGIQPFMVKVRDEETHIPPSGIKIGEVGPKLGYNTVNNGFLSFNHHRIPRRNMLMRNAQVLKDGTFKALRDSKLVYGGMMFVRVMVVITCANQLSRAAIIAVRYSAVRRQSRLKRNEPELQVLDYVTQQHKLFIAIATSYAFTVTSKWLWDMYLDIIGDADVGKTERLSELHALTCCFKVFSSADCSELIESCRLSCGGHGYMLSSNLHQLYGITTAACTYEGENTVLLLINARALARAWEKAMKGEPVPHSMAYLKDQTPLKEWDISVQGIIKSNQKVAAGKIASALDSLMSYHNSGFSYEDAWNRASVQLIGAAEAHGRAVILSVFHSEIERTVKLLSAPLQRVLHQLVELYAYYWTFKRLGDFLLYTQITQKDVQYMQRKYEDVLEAIRPNAVGLVDSFDVRDEILNSTLGAYDGRVYERIMEEALKSPLNQEPVNQSFHKYLKPFLQRSKV